MSQNETIAEPQSLILAESISFTPELSSIRLQLPSPLTRSFAVFSREKSVNCVDTDFFFFTHSMFFSQELFINCYNSIIKNCNKENPLNTLRFLMSSFLFFLIPQISFSANCGDFKDVSGVELGLEGSCLGLALDETDVPWKMPRQILFVSSNEMLISDLGGWGDGNNGKVYLFNISTKKVSTIYSGGRYTHGLGLDQKGRVLIGNPDAILRQKNKSFEPVVTGLPTAGSHPLTHFIVLPNNDLVVNVGAPSDRCQEEMGGGTYCPSRDQEAELRLFSYDTSTDNYSPRYEVLARGLRNSMALLFNSKTETLYQGENNMDPEGTPEEFNEIPLISSEIPDYGWPFCVGYGQQTPGLNANFSSFCNKINKDPLFLIPNHSAPLDMDYYDQTGLFAELQNFIIMGWHGHRREVENAIVAYPTDDFGAPFDRPQTLVGGINTQTGEKIRPVGVAMDDIGKLWFIDDKTKKLYVVSKTNGGSTVQPQGPGFEQRNLDFVDNLSGDVLTEWNELYSEFMSAQTCTRCHSESEFPERGSEGLLAFLDKSWIRVGQSSSESTIIRRMDPELNSPRAMPPPPEVPYGAQHPQNYENLKRWIDKNLGNF